ncbi:hypothetical protein [Lactiplantibacillus mudanjiangensis]|uniref:Sodium:proton antiporter [Lactobacillus pentosus] n=1 Tax=Lactiplantibacillus mudanjiangensis TaxID=1296538 RepID=A0A660DWD5_9LACO|nr:hypothetical protein [Lactiplantibacillus mudanjiangensis]VDG25372.1 sodium:proton antiporter [Lactobacillus pentosus] [Lactiplantibacillus mudanjiangensis]VDG27597.1 sodium:proton antiporter [Lactobacillus pentosus] [Lactiplantibacillus mudanjiangensis]
MLTTIHSSGLNQDTIITTTQTYQLTLTRALFGDHPWRLKVTATTLLGPRTIQVTRYPDLPTAQAAYDQLCLTLQTD